MAKVSIIDPVLEAAEISVTPSPEDGKHHQLSAEGHSLLHGASTVSIVHTVEAMQVAVEDFNDHIETCNVDFKFCVFDKVKTLKGKDTETLT